jgi:6-phosphofructokinase 1
MAAIAGGAEYVVLPEVEADPEKIAETIAKAYERGKSHAIVVVAEGAKYDATALDAYFKEHRERLGFDLRITIIGHVQRGGNPSAVDRIMASRFGATAVRQLLDGNYGVLVGEVKGDIVTTPLEEVVNHPKPLDMALLELAEELD